MGLTLFPRLCWYQGKFLYDNTEYYLMGTVKSSLFLSSVKWIQTVALKGNTLYAAHICREIHNSLKSPVSHSQHLYLPTFVSSTVPSFLFCRIHVSFHPHSMRFVLFVIDIFCLFGFVLYSHDRVFTSAINIILTDVFFPLHAVISPLMCKASLKNICACSWTTFQEKKSKINIITI